MTQPPGGSFMDVGRVVGLLGVSGGQHIADLGCGTGYFAVVLGQAVGPNGVVSAVDVMEEPLQAVTARAEAAGLKNVKAIRADLEVLGGTKIPDGSQDMALIRNVLFQSQKKDAIVTEAARILKPNGRLVLIEWKKGAGGFGPPDELRTDETTLQGLATNAGVRFERTVDTDSFHVGLIFVK